MFDNRLLFQRFGVNWTLAKCFAVLGPLAMVAGALMFLILARHLKLRSRRLTADEAARLLMDPQSTSIVGEDMPSAMNMKAWGTKGAAVSMSFNIDSLRNAARRGDWLTFCLQPAMFTSFTFGMWMLFIAACIAIPRVPLGFPIIVTVFLGLMGGLILFMPWAALYTKIELGSDSGDAEGGVAPPGNRGNPRR